MTTLIAIFMIALIASLIATRLIMPIATRIGVVDRPDGYRKIHVRPIPRLGGVGIYLAVLLPVVLLVLFRNLSQVSEVVVWDARVMFMVWIGATMALLAGILDDVFNLTARWKLLFQVLIATVMYLNGFEIRVISNPFGAPFDLGWLSCPVTLFWFLGCMNAVNLLDGLDGLAAGTTLFVTLTLFLVCLHFGNMRGAVLMSALSGAILGFLTFNFPPARIFLGDCGSMLLGFLVAALSLIGSSRKAEAAVALFIPIVALGLPILDTTIAIVRRWYKRLPISAPDRGHIHHVMISMGYSPRRAVLILYGISVLLGGAAFLITMNRNEVTLMVIASLAIIAFVCIRLFGGVGLAQLITKLRDDQERRRISGETRVMVEKAIRSIENAPATPDDIWHVCEDLCVQLGFESAVFEFRGSARTWKSAGNGAAGSDGWNMYFVLRDGSVEAVGYLSVTGTRDNIWPIPELPDLFDRLRSAISTKLCGGPDRTQ